MQQVRLNIETHKLQSTLSIDLFEISHLGPKVEFKEMELAQISISKRMLYELENRIAAQRLERLVVKIPANWWEHFKKDKLSTWKIGKRYLDKHPVQYKEQQYDVKAYYPKLAFPDESHYITAVKYEPEDYHYGLL